MQTSTVRKPKVAKHSGKGEKAKAEPIRLALADGHSLVRSGLKQLLDSEQEMEVVCTSANREEAIRHLKGHRPDVLVYDPTDEPDQAVTGATMDEFRAASPGTAVIVLSPDDSAASARMALQSGAISFVSKAEEPEVLVEAIRRAVRGEPYLNGRLVIDIARLQDADDADGLTERETEILRLIALGHTNAEIAGILFLSIRTVESHRAHILEKLRLDSRAELVQYAIDHRLIP